MNLSSFDNKIRIKQRGDVKNFPAEDWSAIIWVDVEIATTLIFCGYDQVRQIYLVVLQCESAQVIAVSM